MNIDINNLTPEIKQAIAEQLIKDAFTSKAVHILGDNLAKGLHVLANATQTTTNVTAKWAGTAQVMALPAMKAAVVPAYNCCGRVVTGIATGARAGYKAAVAPKTPVVWFD
jgi:hypothetical protein